MMNTSRDAMSRHRARPLLLWFGIVVILQGCLLTFLPQGVTVITQMLQVASVVLLLLAIVLWRTQLRPGAELFVKTAVGVSTMSVSLLLVRLLGGATSPLVESLIDSLFYFGLSTTAVFLVSSAIHLLRR